MSWFAELAGKAENLLVNLNEETNPALRNQNALLKQRKHDCLAPETVKKKRSIPQSFRNLSSGKRNSAPVTVGSQATPVKSSNIRVKFTRNHSPVKNCDRQNVVDDFSEPSGHKSRWSRATSAQSAKAKPLSKTHSPTRTNDLLKQENESFAESFGYKPWRPQAIPEKSSKVLLSKCNSPTRTNERLNVDDEDFTEPYGYKPRHFSLPTDINDLNYQAWVHKFENVEVENAMLKNELNVTKKEYLELLDRLHRTDEELSQALTKLENMNSENKNVNNEKENLLKQIEQMKSDMINKTNKEIEKLKEEKQTFQTEISVIRERNNDMAELIKHYERKEKERDAIQNKTENDLRHAQSMINLLQSDLKKTIDEYKRLESEWQAYRVRVKNIHISKDTEIKALQQGVKLTKDTDVLVEQVEDLRKERDMLSQIVYQVRNECNDMKQYIDKMAVRRRTTERVITALRDALCKERAARNKAEAEYSNIARNLKSVELEAGATIAKLRVDLRVMESKIDRIQKSSATCSTSVGVEPTQSSALNVADFGVKANTSEDSDKISYLTEKLLEKQSQVEMLMADNNMLKILLDTSETKRKAGNQYMQKTENSVVSFRDGRPRWSFPGKLSRWCDLLVHTHPVFRMFVFLYMICLHIWVFTVLLTSTPDTRPYYYSVNSQS